MIQFGINLTSLEGAGNTSEALATTHRMEGAGVMGRRNSITVTCQGCDQIYTKPVSRIARAERHFHSYACYIRYVRSLDYAIVQFWRKVARCAHGDRCAACCWPWQGWKDRKGYGVFERQNEQGERERWGAHRFAWFLAHGELAHFSVLHDCPDGDLPACVNDLHLWDGTQLDNMHDAKIKGRLATGDRNSSRIRPENVVRGEQHYAAKLSHHNVLPMRQLYAEGATYLSLAERFGVSEHATRAAITGETWKHLS